MSSVVAFFLLSPPKLLYSTLFLLKPTQAHNAVWVCCIFALDFNAQRN